MNCNEMQAVLQEWKLTAVCWVQAQQSTAAAAGSSVIGNTPILL